MSSTTNYKTLNDEKTMKLLDFVGKMEKSGHVVKGVNKSTKCLNRGIAKLVIIATDAEPPELTFSLPIICEDKGVPFVHIGSKISLGKACNLQRPVISACIFCPKDMESLRIEDRVREIL